MPTKKQLIYWESLKGKSSGVKGKHWKLSNETIQKREQYYKNHPEIKRGFKKGHAKPINAYKWEKGEKMFNWKGEKVSYVGLHQWVARELGKPRCCEDCGNKNLNHRQYHWANISGLYKRELSDWRRLCVKCHSVYDRQQKLYKFNKNPFTLTLK